MPWEGSDRRRKAALDAIIRECARDQAPAELVTAAHERLSSVIGYEAHGWMLIDPHTVLCTSGVMSPLAPEIYSRLTAYAFTHEDPLKFRVLVRSPSPVTTLWRATGGQLDRNLRYRRLIAPLEGGDELRAVFRSGGTCWGGVAMSRRAGRRAFSEDDAGLMAQVAGHLGDALRRLLAPIPATSAPSASDPPTAVVILDGNDSVESATREAGPLLRQAAEADDSILPLPVAVYSVAHQARATTAGHGDGTRATARVRLESGRWLALDAEPLADAGGSQGRVAVVIQPARPAQLAPLVLAARGLTARERQIARMLLQGESTEQIAFRLFISRHTLRDHVKAIYAKLGVAGRPEFTALLIHEDPPHIPRLTSP